VTRRPSGRGGGSPTARPEEPPPPGSAPIPPPARVATAARERNRSQRRGIVLEAALAVIAEKGLDETRMVDIGDRAGMSAGHVMYYFPTKADLLMEALQWSEDRFMAEAQGMIASLSSARERLLTLVELSVPSAGTDPAWVLWLETWAHAPHVPAVAQFQRRIEDRWLRLLSQVVREGQTNGDFCDADVEAFVVTLSALIDGLSIRWLGGDGSINREELLRICRTEIELRLLAPHPAHQPGGRDRSRRR
jgi:AcrR family transcriptional regulator